MCSYLGHGPELFGIDRPKIVIRRKFCTSFILSNGKPQITTVVTQITEYLTNNFVHEFNIKRTFISVSPFVHRKIEFNSLERKPINSIKINGNFLN